MPQTIHLIRHGQSTWNAHYAATGEDPLHFDARLTDLGLAQVEARRKELAAERYDLIVTSPLTRAIQTTLGVFAPHLDRVPVVVEALHRERLESSCDVGRPASVLASEFGALAFHHLEEEWWPNGCTPDHRGIRYEPDELFKKRVRTFRRWLTGRPEQRIAVVGHGTFFFHLAGCNLANCELTPFEV
jgi:broad specificity phosphatase PhoE